MAYWYYCGFLFPRYYATLHCTVKCLRQVLLRSFLAIIVLCNVALYSKYFKHLLLRWFIIFRLTHYGILVLLSILVVMVLYSVALYFKYLKQYFAIHTVAYWYYCWFLLLWYYTMLHCTLSFKAMFCQTLWHNGIIVDSCYCGIMQCCIVL